MKLRCGILWVAQHLCDLLPVVSPPWCGNIRGVRTQGAARLCAKGMSDMNTGRQSNECNFAKDVSELHSQLRSFAIAESDQILLKNTLSRATDPGEE